MTATPCPRLYLEMRARGAEPCLCGCPSSWQGMQRAAKGDIRRACARSGKNPVCRASSLLFLFALLRPWQGGLACTSATLPRAGTLPHSGCRPVSRRVHTPARIQGHPKSLTRQAQPPCSGAACLHTAFMQHHCMCMYNKKASSLHHLPASYCRALSVRHKREDSPLDCSSRSQCHGITGGEGAYEREHRQQMTLR